MIRRRATTTTTTVIIPLDSMTYTTGEGRLGTHLPVTTI
jgi:hypothetical protein